MPAGRRATLGEASLIKRLCFESHTVLVSQIRADNDPSADPSARKMPASERTARIEAQRLRLVGLSLEGPLEVGFSVYDFCAGMLESDQLRYLAPHKCVTRSQEVMNLKPAKELKLDNVSGTITVKESAPQLECPTSTELEVLQALTRRSLAFDCTGLIDFHIAQKWVQDLFSVMQQPVAPGFAKISLIQLLRTDRIAFARMTELARTGIKPSSTGVRPLDALMSSMRSDSTVMFYMLPVLAAPSQPSTPIIKRTWDEAFGNKGNGKGKGKGGKVASKGKINGCQMPGMQGGFLKPCAKQTAFAEGASATTLMGATLPSLAKSATKVGACVPKGIAISLIRSMPILQRRQRDSHAMLQNSSPLQRRLPMAQCGQLLRLRRRIQAVRRNNFQSKKVLFFAIKKLAGLQAMLLVPKSTLQFF